MQKMIPSICAYCGRGCRMNFVVDDKRIVKVMPDPTDPVSQGRPCAKGFAINAADNGRITSPMIRKRGTLRAIEWPEAYKFIYDRLSKLKPDEVFIGPSGNTTNEDCYIMQKFARIVLGTNNVDCRVSSREEVNIRGAEDVGGVPSLKALHTEQLEQRWQCALPRIGGKTFAEAFIAKPVKAAVISDRNLTQLPKTVLANMKKMFVVQLSSHLSASKLANVILPTPVLIEREGTISNADHRVRFVRPIRTTAAQPDWVICRELSRLWNKIEHFNYPKALDITREIAHVVPGYHNINVDALYEGCDCWAEKNVRYKRFVP